MPGGRRTRHIPPPPPTPPPDPPINGVNVREQVNAFNAVSNRKCFLSYDIITPLN